MPNRHWRAGVDIGGTFTDLLLVDGESGRFRVGKVLTTAGEPASGVRAVLGAELQVGDVPPDQLGTVVHGTTLVTNALIERKGALSALLITEGFRDTLLIGREHRYDMYDGRIEKPEPLVPRRLSFAVPERVLADGTVHRPLDEAAVAVLADELRARGVRAVGVCLLHAHRHPEHELRVREILKQRYPELRIALSHEVVGELREYERASTTVANANVLDLVDRYLGRLERDLAEIGHRGEFLVMLSSGATATPETARRFPVRLMESGPAAGALAAAHLGRLMGRPNLLSFDMGGTTAKACLIEPGRPTIATDFEVGRLQRFKKGSGLPIKISSVELIEIGAGGGSIARVDRFGLVKVGVDIGGPAWYMLAQAVTGTPGHINSMARCIRHVLDEYPAETLEPGDVIITNDPWLTSGHHYDVTIVTPMFRGETLVAFFGNICHTADIGGRPYGPDAIDVYEEGLHIPILKLFRRGQPNADLFKILRTNVRSPMS